MRVRHDHLPLTFGITVCANLERCRILWEGFVMSEILTTGRSVAMGETFGHRLKQFALAVDIVEQDMFNHVQELVLRYVSLELELAYWALLIEGEVDRNPGL